MSDDDWDVSDSEVPPPPVKVASKWADEDVEDDVKARRIYTILIQLL